MLFVIHIEEKKTISSPYEAPYWEQNGDRVIVEIKNNGREFLSSF